MANRQIKKQSARDNGLSKPQGSSPADKMMSSQQDDKKPSQAGFLRILISLVLFLLGLGSGYVLWGIELIQSPTTPSPTEVMKQIHPDQGYELPVSYGQIGPDLLASGAVDADEFIRTYKKAGQPLSRDQKEILTDGTVTNIIFTQENSYFLLNYFWALGLVNQNSILTEGPMMKYGVDQIEQFASTGGWTLGTKSAEDLYASTPIINLKPEQQARLERVVQNVYRPCCNNPTHFPDCNHGMAMLGMLTLLASKDASEAGMYQAAKYANAYWFPQQSYKQTLYFNIVKGQDFENVDPQTLVGREFSSASGFRSLHQYLSSKELLQQPPGGGSSCGV
jgi:hypothetical protein